MERIPMTVEGFKKLEDELHRLKSEERPRIIQQIAEARALAEASNAQSKLERARLLFDRDPPLLSAQDFADIQTRFEVATTTVGVERLNAQALLADALAKSSTLQVAMARLADPTMTPPTSAMSPWPVSRTHASSRRGSRASDTASPRAACPWERSSPMDSRSSAWSRSNS
jgi:hypothetical protein